MPVLWHPGTGGEFYAEDKAVPLYLAGGWVVKDTRAGDQEAGRQPEQDDDGQDEPPAKAAAGKTAAGTTKPAAPAGGSAEES